MPTQKRRAAAAAPVPKSAPAFAARAEQSLRDVLDYMRHHGGRMPSQHAPDTKKLYFSLRNLRSKQNLSASATVLLREIEAVQKQAVAAQDHALAERVAFSGCSRKKDCRA